MRVNGGPLRDLIPSMDRDEPIPLFRSDEHAELGGLLEELRPYLLAIANAELPQFLAGKLGASDAAQWTITQAYCRFADFRGTTTVELASWMRQILLNHLKTIKRRYSYGKRSVAREQSADIHLIDHRQGTASGAALSREEWSLLKNALDRLPDVHRQAINLRNVDNLSFAEIGHRLNRSEEAARKIWARAIRQLQKELGIDGGRHGPGDERPSG